MNRIHYRLKSTRLKYYKNEVLLENALLSVVVVEVDSVDVDVVPGKKIY
jgi:hypothetical protein